MTEAVQRSAAPLLPAKAPGRMATLARSAGLVLAALLPTIGLIDGPIYAPLVFAAGAAGLFTLALRRRALLQADWALIALGIAFIAWIWLGLAWTISVPRTASGAAQASVVLPAALAFVMASRLFPSAKAGLLAATLTLAACAGLLALGSDRLDGLRVLHAIDGSAAWPTKYNRGIDYAVLLLMPAAGFWATHRRWRWAAALAAILCVTIAAGWNTTAQLGLPVAILVGGLGAVSPRVTAGVLAVATSLEALGMPFVMPVITRLRPAIAPHIKLSGLERLEIWDYLSAHALQRPLTGWGLWTSRLLPATAAEKSHFIKATGSGIYAHNHWLELWVELGLPGVLIGLAFALIVLHRASRHPHAPFALAATAFALVVASSGFEVTTDSWWAALAASAALFSLFATPDYRATDLHSPASTAKT